MSRQTQYIGLNKYAEDYVENAVHVETYDMTTGMFGEPIKGRIFYMPEDKYGNYDILIEYVQDVPWSSGPMIFTCIECKFVHHKQGLDTFNDSYFMWMIDPGLGSCECDYETGRYWV
jgi:hypothetical protein